jgi:hypothetical protein
MALGSQEIENALVGGTAVYVKGNGGIYTKLPIQTTSTITTAGLVNTGTSTGGKRAVTASGGTTRTLTAANSGSVNLFDSAAGITYTLPAPVVGLTYDFVWTVSQSSSAHVIVTDAGTTFLLGGASMFSATDVTPSATLGPKFFAANGTTHIKFTSNATTTGTAIGSWLRLICVTATQWYVNGVVDSPSGSIATPFST